MNIYVVKVSPYLNISTYDESYYHNPTRNPCGLTLYLT